METTIQRAGQQIAPPPPGVLFWKRAFDVVCSALGLLVLSPVLLACAALFGLTRQIESGLIAGCRLLPAWLYHTGLLGNFLGFPAPEFTSSDYFPLLPWIFLYGVGYFLHALWLTGEGPERGRHRRPVPVLGWLGRHSLVVYLLHQPVLYGLLLAAETVL